MKNQYISKTLPEMPKLIISGSATQLTANQIEKLADSDDFEKTYFINLDVKTIIDGVNEELINRVVNNLGQSNIVVVHTSHLIKDFDGFFG